MKKVYFACSIRSERDDQKIYKEIVGIIKNYAEVLSELFADGNLTAHGTPKPTKEIWKDDLVMLESADAMIAEVTNPSIGVGYEIAKAEELKKPILCLYRPQPERSLSGMIAGSPHVKVITYTNIEDLEKPVQIFISNLEL